MRLHLMTSLIAMGLFASTAAFAGGPSEQRVDAAVDAIVRELAAVGAGPRDTTMSAPGAERLAPGTLRRLGSLADEAAEARRLTETEEGEDDHAM